MVPVIVSLLSLLLVAANIILWKTNVMDLTGMILGLELSFMLFIIRYISYIVIYLLYQNRKQALDRPIYLIEETSGDLDVE